MPMSPRTIAFWAIIFASIFWSTAGVVGKILLTTYDPFVVAFFRFFFASLVMIPILLRQPLPDKNILIKKVIPICLLSAGNISFFYFGLKLTTVTATGIIYTATPLLVGLFSFYLLKERLTRLKFLGIFVGALGVILIVSLPNIDRASALIGDLKGNILICLAVVCWAFYTLGSRYLIKAHSISAISLTGISIVSNAVIFFFFSLIFAEKAFIPSLVTPVHIALILYLAIFVTAVTLILYQWAIMHTSAATAVLTNYLQPIFGTILAITLLGERISLGFLIGSSLVFLGVLIVTSNVTKDFLRRLSTGE